jgi:multidrug efflux pump subunit AcrA (membrane-fusion protein)
MFATAAFAIDEAKDVVVAPIEAIDRTSGDPTVLVVDGGGRVESRGVTLGLETPDRVAVTRGLAAGDLVVVGNRAQLKPGIVVTPRVMSTTSAEGNGR